jgi:hypothetical protein
MDGRHYVTLAIYAKDPDGWGVGAEVYTHEPTEGGRAKNNVYHIFSYYLPRADFPSKRSVIHHMYSQILPKVADNAESVQFISTLQHFKNAPEQRRKACAYAGGKVLTFKQVDDVKKITVMLAIDAVKRRTSIDEKIKLIKGRD